MQKEYKTVLKHAVVEMEEKKSRFIASVKPVSNEQQALDFIKSLKKKYWNASHNVYAYCIKQDGVIQRYSDDGEPAGTAGMPVMEVIKRMQLQNLVVVITRYFGGTLLGAAGLIRAYGKCASMGIKCAGIIIKQLAVETNMVFEYNLLDKVNKLIETNKFVIKNTKYQHDVEMYVFIPVDKYEMFVNSFNEISNGAAFIERKKETVYI